MDHLGGEGAVEELTAKEERSEIAELIACAFKKAWSVLLELQS
jgi:hypothetical protein